MGELWMGIWIFTFIGLFIIAIAIYDYFDRKKRNQEIKTWKYLLKQIERRIVFCQKLVEDIEVDLLLPQNG